MPSSRRRFNDSPPARSSTSHLVRLVVGLGLVLAFMYAAWQKAQEKPAVNLPPPGANRPVEIEVFKPEKGAKSTADDLAVRTQIKNLKIRNQDGKVIYKGDVDLQETLDRIARGERESHDNDGSVFQNREKRLPEKPAGYYHEWVHPTPGLRGPGPQRIVTGKEQEFYYTPDHYETFQRLDSRKGASGRGE
jgi:guanyl-specific ribonuclease Sa